MKKLFAVIGFISILILPSTAQERHNSIKTNGLALIIGLPNIAYERAINDKISVQAAFAFTSFKLVDTRFGGYAITPELRFYPSKNKEAINGFYLGPVMNISNFDLEVEKRNAKASLNLICYGGKFGWHWLLGKSDNFSMDLGLGVAYTNLDLNIESGREEDFNTRSISGIIPLLAFSLGYAF